MKDQSSNGLSDNCNDGHGSNTGHDTRKKAPPIVAFLIVKGLYRSIDVRWQYHCNRPPQPQLNPVEQKQGHAQVAQVDACAACANGKLTAFPKERAPGLPVAVGELDLYFPLHGKQDKKFTGFLALECR